MARIITDSQHYTDIAAAIRAKNGSGETYTPAQMAAAIAAIETGGGGALAFTVVGGTAQPASASENTIWVSTDADITGWRFGTDVPGDLAEGEVFFRIGLSGGTAVSAIADAGIAVYLLSCVQAASGQTVARSAQIYQDGAWATFDSAQIYLFNGGAVNDDVTGGWVKRGVVDGAGDLGHYYTDVDNVLRISAMSDVSGGTETVHIYVSTQNLIDVTYYNALSFVYDDTSLTSGGSRVVFGLVPSDFTWIPDNGEGFAGSAVVKSDGSSGTVTVDIAELTGAYYVAVEIMDGMASIETVAYVDVHSVLLD